MHNNITNRISFSALKISRLITCFMLFFLLCTFGSAWSQQTICIGSVKHYAVDTAENAGLGTTGSTYNWTVIGGSFLGTILPTVVGPTNAVIIDWQQTPPGNYTVSVLETNSNGCSQNQILQVFIKPLPVVRLNDLIVCIDPITGNWPATALLATRLSPSIYSFVWQRDGILLSNTTASINVTQTGVYSVTVTNLTTGCQSTDSATVSVSSAPQATVTVGNAFDEVQNIVVAIVSGVGSYEYSIDGINFQDSGTFSVSEPGNYTVIVKDKNFCGETRLPVFVTGYPKFFSPNGDSYNDFWNIIALPNPLKSKIFIFDRYGKFIHQIKPNTFGWDGTLNGFPLPATDYWFTVEYYDIANNFQTFKSHFSLIR
jgi:gliding motility-associated-like protein